MVDKCFRDNPTERIGYGVNGLKDVQKHKWFDGFNWDGLRVKKLTAPVTPRVSRGAALTHTHTHRTSDVTVTS